MTDNGEMGAIRMLAEVMPAVAPVPVDQTAAWWRALLVKYIDHVGAQEGTDFLVVREPRQWTDGEWDALQEAAEETR